MQQMASKPQPGGTVGHRRPADFDPDDERYMCCCNSMHVRIGARVIGAVELTGTVLAFALLIGFYAAYRVTAYGYELLVSPGALAVGIILVLGSLAVIACMFLAIQAENHTMLMPHLIAQLFSLIGMLFAFIVGVVILIGYNQAQFGAFIYNLAGMRTEKAETEDPQAGKIVGAVVLVLCVIGFILQVWFMSVIYGLYQYYRNKNRI